MPAPASDIQRELTRLHTQLTTVRGISFPWQDIQGRAALARVVDSLESRIRTVEGQVREQGRDS